MTSPMAKEILTDLSPILKLYTDGTVDRLIDFSYTPPTPNHPTTGVSSKDTTLPPARLYLPKLTTPNDKFPTLVYYHGGGFCIGSSFCSMDHRYLNILSAQANALIVSVEYRLAPEHPIPAAYEDSWAALKWVSSHFLNDDDDDSPTDFVKDPWITNHGDFNRVFIGGDSAGGNIAHNIAMRAGSEPLPGGIKISGAILSHPYFWGSNPVGNEPLKDKKQHFLYKLWVCAAHPDVVGGIDNPMINPMACGAPSLSGLGCERMFVCVAEKDGLYGRGIGYVEKVKESGWGGEVEVVEIEGEDHCFHMFDPETDKAKYLIKRIASFISS